MCHKSATTSFLNPYFAKKFSKPSNVFLRLVSPPEPMRRTPSKLNPFGTSLCFHLRTASSYPKFGACSNDFYCTKVAFIYNETHVMVLRHPAHSTTFWRVKLPLSPISEKERVVQVVQQICVGYHYTLEK